jgi:hypothetical protein
MNNTITRTARLELELGAFTTAQLDRPMFDLEVTSGYNIAEIDSLVSEVGAASSKVYVNDGRGWNKTLRQTITELVNSIYTLDDQTVETLEELEAIRNS